MWQIKNLKKKGKKNLKNNLWTLLLVGLFMTLIIGEYVINNNGYTNINILGEALTDVKENGTDIEAQKQNIGKYVDEAVSKILTGKTINLIEEYNKKNNVTKGVFYTIFNAFTIGERQLQNIGNSTQNFMSEPLKEKFLIIIVTILAMAIRVFISYPLLVGESRIYMESINYDKTKLRRLLFSFKKGRYLSSIRGILRMKIYQALWNFTIIGGIIKNYSYKMTTYILAENPEISSKDAIKMSREMMNGSKLKCLAMDLSFIPWYILEYVTFGLVGIYATPYIKSTYTALYETLRKDYIENKKYNFEALNDNVLFDRSLLKQKYPDYSDEELAKVQVYPDKYEIAIKKVKIDHDKKYEVTSIILFFFIFSIAGWIWEVLLFLFSYGKLVNRGSLYGPWLPIYGTGCTMIIIATQFKAFRNTMKKPFWTFIIVTIACSVIEYLTSWYTEVTMGVRYWDYTGIFMNINGRVCLENSIFFGIGGCICIYFIAPFLERKIQNFDTKIRKIDKTKQIALCTILITLFGIDQVYSHFHPHTGEYITQGSEQYYENEGEQNN